MSIVTASGIIGLPFVNNVGTTNNMNGSTSYSATILQVPKTGTLHSFEILIGTVANNPDNGVRLSFQTVGATGLPDGTQDQFRDVTGTLTSGWLTPPGPLTDDGTDTGIKRSVTRGEWLACKIEFVSFVAGDSYNTINLVTDQVITMPYRVINGSKASNPVVIALKYDDGTYAYVEGLQAVSSTTQVAYANNDTPDERALRFQAPVPVRVSGCLIRGALSADCDIVLYDASDNVLESLSVDGDFKGAGVITTVAFKFDTSVELDANTTYRLAFKPTTTTDVNLIYATLPGAGYLPTFPGGIEWYQSTRTNAGAWTDTNTQVPMIALLVDGLDDGTGSGGSGGEVSHVFIG